MPELLKLNELNKYTKPIEKLDPKYKNYIEQIYFRYTNYSSGTLRDNIFKRFRGFGTIGDIITKEKLLEIMEAE
jgi:hypothetical protein